MLRIIASSHLNASTKRFLYPEHPVSASNRPTSIYYLSGGRNVPTVRFRMAFLNSLTARGHRVSVLHAVPSRYDYFPAIGWRLSQMFRRLVRRWHLLQIRLRKPDVVVLETGFSHTNDGSLETELRAITKRLVFELDDAVFLLFPEKLQSIATMADHVIVGNRELADWASQYNKSVSIIPTCIDSRDYSEKSELSSSVSKSLVVGWIGSQGNLSMLKVCVPAMRRVHAKIPFEFRIITAATHQTDAVDLSGLDVKWIDIDRCDIVEQLQSFDVGLMPLPADEPWMRYKCNAKMIQYMAVGVPAVASKIGFNLELVQHGEHSLLASTDEEWQTSLFRLLNDSDLRKTLGNAARKTALERFTVQSRIEEYESAIVGSR